MALASRLLSRSRQLYSAHPAILNAQATAVRSYADRPPAVTGDKLLKDIFFDIKRKFEIALEVLRKEKITIDPEDSAAVRQYANIKKTIREKADVLSESQKIKYVIETETKGIPDARTYLLTLQNIREKNGLTDDLGVEAMMMEALEKIEKQIKKPLLREDKKNMGVLLGEFDKINKKLGIRKEDLPKYEEELELEIAKEELEIVKKDAIEEMGTQLKKEEFKDEKMPDVKTLDIRNFL